MLCFDFAQQLFIKLPHGQLYCRGLLMSAKRLKKAEDATGGQAAALAAKGISPVHKLAITARDIIFVVDRYFVYKPGMMGSQTACDQLDFLLNGQFYRLETQMVAATATPTAGAWESYKPVSIQKISMPLSVMQGMFAPEKQQTVPAPTIIATVPPPGQQPSSAFTMDPQSGPESAYVTVFKQEPVYV